jgi:prepilin-type N-terminal cleavage/methylation domain-containing protein
MARALTGRSGFTLVEILIVIAIISVLASMTTAGVILARENARKAVAKVTLAGLTSALGDYILDTGRYPGAKAPAADNAFPDLYEALAGLRPPKGGGGPSAPYFDFKLENLMVPDDGAVGGFREAVPSDLRDPKVPKYARDPWGNPYVYVENRSHPDRAYPMRPGKADIYSTGRDGIDQTAEGEKGDDIGNW